MSSEGNNQGRHGLAVTMVRCSTLVLTYRGVNFLTDPWFSNWMRFLPVFRRAGIPLESIPQLDAMLVSHLHPDHFETHAVETLARRTCRGLKVIGPPGMKKAVGSIPGTELHDLSPGASTTVSGVAIHSVSASHTYPLPEEVNFVLDFPGFGRVFFGGDTRLNRNTMRSIASRFAPVALALLPVSGTRIFGRRTVMNPMDAYEAAVHLQARNVIPIHEGGIWPSVPPASLHPGRNAHLQRLTRRHPGGPAAVLLSEGESVTLLP